jgi:hypothetical protein
MKNILATLIVVLIFVSTVTAVNTLKQDSNAPITMGDGPHDLEIVSIHSYESNEVTFEGDGNSVTQWNDAPSVGTDIYQYATNRVDVTGDNNKITQINGWSAVNNGENSRIEQDLYSYALVKGNYNTVFQMNNATARIDQFAENAYITQTATNLAYVGRLDDPERTSTYNTLVQLNSANATIFSGLDGYIEQRLKNEGMQQGYHNELYQGVIETNPKAYTPNFANASIGFSGERSNFNTIEQAISNNAIQNGTGNLAYQMDYAYANITDFDYNTITQSQRTSAVQDGSDNFVNQGWQGSTRSNFATALINGSCKTEINQRQVVRGYQYGSEHILNQATTADGYINNSGWEYLMISADIDQDQKLMATQGGSSNTLNQDSNTATAEIQDSSGAEIDQGQKSRGSQSGSGNTMNQENLARAKLHYAMDKDNWKPFPYGVGDFKGNAIEQDQRNNGEQSLSNSNDLGQSNDASSVNFDTNDPSHDNELMNGWDEHSVQIQSNDAREWGPKGTPTALIIEQTNDADTVMLGAKDETKLISANIAAWKGTNKYSKTVDQDIGIYSSSDPTRDTNTDVIEVTAKNIAQIKYISSGDGSISASKGMGGFISATYSGENPIVYTTPKTWPWYYSQTTY